MYTGNAPWLAMAMISASADRPFLVWTVLRVASSWSRYRRLYSKFISSAACSILPWIWLANPCRFLLKSRWCCWRHQHSLRAIPVRHTALGVWFGTQSRGVDAGQKCIGTLAHHKHFASLIGLFGGMRRRKRSKICLLVLSFAAPIGKSWIRFIAEIKTYR